MATIKELKEQAQQLTDQAETLLLEAEKEGSYTAEEQETMKSLVSEIIDAETEAAEKERKSDIEQAVARAETALKKMQNIFQKEGLSEMATDETVNALEGTAKEDAAPEKVETYIYIGPTMPKKNLRAGNCFRGTKKDVLTYLGADKIPHMEKMLVLIQDYNKKKAELQSKKTLLSRYYEEMCVVMEEV